MGGLILEDAHSTHSGQFWQNTFFCLLRFGVVLGRNSQSVNVGLYDSAKSIM